MDDRSIRCNPFTSAKRECVGIGVRFDSSPIVEVVRDQFVSASCVILLLVSLFHETSVKIQRREVGVKGVKLNGKVFRLINFTLVQSAFVEQNHTVIEVACDPNVVGKDFNTAIRVSQCHCLQTQTQG